MLLMLDNYDSFTWNLVQYLEELGQQVCVLRNDEQSVQQIADMAPEIIVISPGPCTPDEAGISVELVQHMAGRVPILGVCLGMQAMAQAFGASIVRAHTVMHGKLSAIEHDGSGLFTGCDPSFTATRYHSLVVAPETLPDALQATAWALSEDGEARELMALRHRELPLVGVQFHPESIASEHGHDLLRNFLDGRY